MFDPQLFTRDGSQTIAPSVSPPSTGETPFHDWAYSVPLEDDEAREVYDWALYELAVVKRECDSEWPALDRISKDVEARWARAEPYMAATPESARNHRCLEAAERLASMWSNAHFYEPGVRVIAVDPIDSLTEDELDVLLDMPTTEGVASEPLVSQIADYLAERNAKAQEIVDQQAKVEFETEVARHELQIKARNEAQRRVNAESYDGLGGVILWDELDAYLNEPWLVQDLISMGEPALLVSKRNIGKSMLAFAMGFSVAMGKPFLGRPVAQGRVMFILGEGVRGFKKRLRAWCAANGVDPEELRDRILVYKGGNFSNDSSIADLHAQAAHFDPILVVVDTWTSLSGVVDEVKQMETMAALNALKTVAPDAAKLILHHPNAETEDTDKPKSRGGTALPSAAETVLTMYYDHGHNVQALPNEKWIALSTEERHGGKQKEEEQTTIHGLRLVEAADGMTLDHYTGSTINAHDQWVFHNVSIGDIVTVKDLEASTGASENTIRRHLKGSKFVRESLSKTGGPNEYIRTP